MTPWTFQDLASWAANVNPSAQFELHCPQVALHAEWLKPFVQVSLRTWLPLPVRSWPPMRALLHKLQSRPLHGKAIQRLVLRRCSTVSDLHRKKSSHVPLQSVAEGAHAHIILPCMPCTCSTVLLLLVHASYIRQNGHMKRTQGARRSDASQSAWDRSENTISHTEGARTGHQALYCLRGIACPALQIMHGTLTSWLLAWSALLNTFGALVELLCSCTRQSNVYGCAPAPGGWPPHPLVV